MSQFVYIIDDEPEVRASLRALLGTRKNLHIMPYTSGDNFLDAYGDQEPGVALLDIHMPGRSGIEVLKCLNDMGAHHQVIVLTGQGDIAMAVNAMRLGATDFLEKPYDHVALFNAIDAAFINLADEQESEQRSAAARALFDGLSDRERQIFDGLYNGGSNKSIAIDLDIAPRTVEFHRANMMSKLGVETLPEAIRLLFTAGPAPVGNTRGV